jgi:putative phage-type endonuclease
MDWVTYFFYVFFFLFSFLLFSFLLFFGATTNPKKMDKLARIKAVPVLEQRSPAWFAKRLTRITSSEASAVLGENPYESAEDVFFRKRGLGKPFTGNVATRYGQENEPVAIAAYCAALGRSCVEVGLIDYEAIHGACPSMSFMAGSPDGITLLGAHDPEPIMLEVKCPYRRKIVPGTIPRHYVAQVQLNMLICGLSHADFVEFRPSPTFELSIVRVYPDRAWLDAAIPVLRAFSEMMARYAGDKIVEHPSYAKYNARYGPDAKPSRAISVAPKRKDPCNADELETAWMGDSFF